MGACAATSVSGGKNLVLVSETATRRKSSEWNIHSSWCLHRAAARHNTHVSRHHLLVLLLRPLRRRICVEASKADLRQSNSSVAAAMFRLEADFMDPRPIVKRKALVRRGLKNPCFGSGVVQVCRGWSRAKNLRRWSRHSVGNSMGRL